VKEWPTGVHPVDVNETKRCLAASLVGTETADSQSVGAGLLRSLLWAYSRNGDAPYVLRFMNPALDLWMAYRATANEHEAREQLNLILEDLETAGDALALPEGRWLPGPTREVDLATGDGSRLLVGGLPTNVLPRGLRPRISHHGAFRRLRGDLLRPTISLPVETVDSWTGSPPDLGEWARKILAADLPPYSPNEEDADFRIYSGQPCRIGAPQSHRWVDRTNQVLPGRYLARRQRVFGAREYRVVEIANGRIVRSGSILLPGEARRLQYAIDTRSGNPVHVKTATDREGLIVYLTSEVPRSEQRLFAALGRLEAPGERYYPRVWHFPKERHPLVVSRLHALGAKVVTS
jgi:hypothetical protein